jgi:hypothetical protein
MSDPKKNRESGGDRDAGRTHPPQECSDDLERLSTLALRVAREAVATRLQALEDVARQARSHLAACDQCSDAVRAGALYEAIIPRGQLMDETRALLRLALERLATTNPVSEPPALAESKGPLALHAEALERRIAIENDKRAPRRRTDD